MKLIMIIAVAVLISSALPTEASDVERRIEANLSKNLDNMNKSFRKYKEVKTAIPEGTKNREKTLKMVTARLERELEATRLALKSLTLYLDFQEFGNLGMTQPMSWSQLEEISAISELTLRF